MYVGHIQNLRYKLDKRVKRLKSTDWHAFHFSLKQFWGFLKSYPIFVGILTKKQGDGSLFDNSRLPLAKQIFIRMMFMLGKQ